MDSMFQSPLMLLKSGSMPAIGGSYEEEIAPTFESTKARDVLTAAILRCNSALSFVSVRIELASLQFVQAEGHASN